MKTVTMYEAEDGRRFSTETACLEYEQQCRDAQDANEMLENGATLMAVLTRANQARPWWDSGMTLEDKAILIKTTKDTGFVVRHWQCSAEPKYKACRVNNDGHVMLHGDTYGCFVSLRDLLRYAHQTFAKHTTCEE